VLRGGGSNGGTLREASLYQSLILVSCSFYHILGYHNVAVGTERSQPTMF
jgi:hypothetical protein